MENIEDKIEHILLYGSIDDINKPIDDKGFTPLHYCVQSCGYSLPIGCIPKSRIKKSVYEEHKERKDSYEKLVKELLNSEANPNAQDNDGNTPLMIACKFQNIFIMRYLLEAGADPHIKNKEFSTALSYLDNNSLYRFIVMIMKEMI
jgi:ankyrin repeat protein